MTVNTLSKQTVQPVAWKKENQPIPENDLNDIVDSAMHMPCALFTSYNRANIKPYKIWLPHREAELQNALSCASIWALDQCQDQTFHNASTILVYVVSECEHIGQMKPAELKISCRHTESWAGSDRIMDARIAKDWIGTRQRLDKIIEDEAERRKTKTFDEKPVNFNPMAGWDSEHLTGMNLTIGLAMAAVSLRCRELGYFCQNYTAYRQVSTWHHIYKNKFHNAGKWIPYMIQVLGTSPEAIKMSQTRKRRQANHNGSIFDPNDMNLADDSDNTEEFEYLSGREYKTKFRDKSPRIVPDYQIDFFTKNFGQYSSDARALFQKAFTGRVGECETFYDEWLGKKSDSE